jgi:hypothetical protein
MAERKRYFLSFDMGNPRHREAEALYAKQAARQRTDFVVSSILMANQAELLEQAVRQTIRHELKNLRLASQNAQPEPDMNAQMSDLPDSLINALGEL